MKGYLLDTNVLSELRKGNRADPQVLAWFQSVHEEELFVSVLVIGEIRRGIEKKRPKDPAQALVLEKWLLGLESSYADRVLPVNTTIADRWGRLSAVDAPSVVDGLMAATALENDLTLITRNIQDVKRTGAKVLDPFNAASS